MSEVYFSVLGPVRAWRGDEELDLGSPQQRVVLAALLLRRGRLVTVGELIDAVWGDAPPSAAVSVLRTYVSRLRRVLEPERGASWSPRVVVSVADGYMAHVADGALDLGVFEQRVAEARQRHAAGETSAAAELLQAALDGWEGTPLAGLPGPLAAVERARLTETWLSTLESRLDTDIRRGRHGEVIDELTSLTDEYPLRERLCLLLMLALFRSGRQAEALACYRRTRRILVDELGIEPGADLQELHDRILTGDVLLDLSPSSEQIHPPPAPPPAGPQIRPAQLPADLATFTGREAELRQVRALLSQYGSRPTAVVISAIAGMAGIGKTALAVHWAHEIADRFPDGQLFINLRGFDPAGSAMPPGEAIRIFLDALGVPAQQMPAQLDAQAALYRSLLAHRRVLILLDNARDADQVRPLLPGSPGCLVVVTSRDQLTGLIVGHGAQPLILHQLTSIEAREFLVRRLGAERLAAQPRAVDDIIARCGRLPLALAVVAARAVTRPGFPLSALADELSDSHDGLDVFDSGELGTDVRAVFSWSYEALSVPAARLFRLLGLFPGPDDFSAPAAAALAGRPLRETHGLLAELTHAHLLTESRPGRYALHDLLRIYAAEQVLSKDPPSDRDRALERLLSWYLHTADATCPFLTPGRRRVSLEPPPPDCHPLAFTGYDQALEWCETERANLVSAVHRAAACGHPGIAWRLPAALWGFFYLRSHLHDWLDTAQTGVAAADSIHDCEGLARLIQERANVLGELGRYDEAIADYRQVLIHYRELGDTVGRSQAVGNLGNAYLQSGRLDKAVEYLRRALAMDRYLGRTWGVGIALANLGDAYQRLGRFDEATDCLKEALSVLRTSGNRWVEGVTLDILGTVAHRLHRLDDAMEYYHQALAVHQDTGNRWGEGHTLTHLGDVHLTAGEREAARTSWRRALKIFEEFDHQDAEEIRDRLRRLGRRLPPS
ncbi:AfsR/SARP family transcriptional regulator [Streptomyces sp. NRRL S-813]|uniref:AfsR/SARP family transcriptional regulator n=1 Tax=Streptomyces sp. NRRL S-813 TaxID=1463919 RepID=UPI000565CEE5|nr:BTAD domain-containing putative transcriptional regulator [Streptomyces sp. NRRL S-813]